MDDHRCSWMITEDKRCNNNVLMDGLCVRHLKQKCSICFENVKSLNSLSTKRLTCGHSFHLNCILGWYVHSDECPVCRRKQNRDPLITYRDNVEEKMRKKYKDAIRTLEIELIKLRRRVNTPN